MLKKTGQYLVLNIDPKIYPRMLWKTLTNCDAPANCIFFQDLFFIFNFEFSLQVLLRCISIYIFLKSMLVLTAITHIEYLFSSFLTYFSSIINHWQKPVEKQILIQISKFIAKKQFEDKIFPIHWHSNYSTSILHLKSRAMSTKKLSMEKSIVYCLC